MRKQELSKRTVIDNRALLALRELDELIFQGFCEEMLYESVLLADFPLENYCFSANLGLQKVMLEAWSTRPGTVRQHLYAVRG